MAEKVERRTQVERRDEAERRMLEAGVRLVSERSLDALTMSDVGIAAGYSRGLPAHHFGTKARFQAALAKFIRHEFEVAIVKQDRGVGLDGLVAFIGSFFDHSADNPLCLSVMNVVLSDVDRRSSFSPEVAKMRTIIFDRIAQHVSEGVDAGEIRTGVKPRQVTLLLVAAIDGVLREWIFDRTIDIVAAGEEMISLMVTGLAEAQARKAWRGREHARAG